MKLSRQIRLAALVGAVTEAILVVPLLLVYYLHLYTIYSLLIVLDALYIPGFPIADWLGHTRTLAKLAARFRIGPELATSLSVLAMLIQAALFTLLAFGVIHFLRSAKALQFSFRSKRTLVAAFAPPLVILLIRGALMFPYYLLSDDEAGLLLSVSVVWLAIAFFLLGTTLAARRIPT